MEVLVYAKKARARYTEEFTVKTVRCLRSV